MLLHLMRARCATSSREKCRRSRFFLCSGSCPCLLSGQTAISVYSRLHAKFVCAARGSFAACVSILSVLHSSKEFAKIAASPHTLYMRFTFTLIKLIVLYLSHYSVLLRSHIKRILQMERRNGRDEHAYATVHADVQRRRRDGLRYSGSSTRPHRTQAQPLNGIVLVPFAIVRHVQHRSSGRQRVQQRLSARIAASASPD